MSKVQAVSRATGKEFDALREKAREMGAKTKFSASEAADAMNYMAMAGWKTEDMLSGIEGIFIAQYNYQKLQSEMENIASPKWRKLQRIF